MRTYLAEDLNWICKFADAVFVISRSWQTSRGCTAEIAAAIAVDVPVWAGTYQPDRMAT